MQLKWSKVSRNLIFIYLLKTAGKATSWKLNFLENKIVLTIQKKLFLLTFYYAGDWSISVSVFFCNRGICKLQKISGQSYKCSKTATYYGWCQQFFSQYDHNLLLQIIAIVHWSSKIGIVWLLFRIRVQVTLQIILHEFIVIVALDKNKWKRGRRMAQITQYQH